MHLKSILNRVQKHPSFVYETMRLVERPRLTLEVRVRPRAGTRATCSQCRRRAPGYDTQAVRRFDFVPLWHIPVVFLYAMRRVDCPRCGVRVEALPWATGKHRLTDAYAWFLAGWAKRLSWREVAAAFPTSWDTVYRAVRMAVDWGLAHRDLTNIEAIGVDELSRRRGQRYLTLVYQIDGHRKRLLWIGRERKAATLEGFFDWFGPARSAALYFVCSDMWKPYLKVVAERARLAVQVLDRFHIMSHFSEAIDEVRAAEARKLAAEGRAPVLKRSRWLLLKRPEKLTDEQRGRLAELVRRNLRTVRAYLLKEDFQALWDYVSPHWAGQFLDRWCTRTMRSRIERLVKRVYKVEKTLSPPRVTNLDAYLGEPAFRALVRRVVWQKAEYIRRAGNVAVHGNKTPAPEHALNVVRELAHVLYWAGRTYLRRGAESLQGKTFDESLVPAAGPGAAPASVEELDTLKRDLDAAEDARKDLEGELEALRERLAATKAENDAVPETRDWSESTTRGLIIDLALERAGWTLGQRCVREYKLTGMPNASGVGYADYVLWGDDGKPLAVVEAKKTTVDAAKGRQQAKLYADCLETMHGQRPIVYYTNGYETHLWDDRAYAPRAVAGFHKKDELAALLHRRPHRERRLDVARVRNAIVERYYQKRAIGSIGEQFFEGRRKALLVMATGSGKTRVAIALVDLLQRAGWVKRALFLADRVSLVNQAVGAFKAHLPESSPVNLVTEKDKTGRVYVCTYPTMMGLIDETAGTEARFGVGHFDLVIIDEAHRSVYQKYGAIFRYFDSLLVGLTATPRDQVDRNTYDLFKLKPGVPTDAYELATAVTDGFLVPPKVQQVDLRFPRDGIDYDELSEEEQAQWESLDWGDDEDGGGLPERVDASAINNWLFNRDTVDKVLRHLMEHGHTVDGGDRLAKTIIFARNHAHATFIEERFNHHYPRYAGHFARVIDHQATYPQSLIDDFARKDEAPHIAISVDMLDTGIDIPEVANLVFFKPVYSRIKFWQMIGRGTRLCPDLFGPGEDKHDFRVFDFCFNFDFFREHPEGIEDSGDVSLRARLFRTRVQLLTDVQAAPDLDPEGALAGALTTELHGEVAAMNRENFIVRMQLEAVERFRQRESWERLTAADVEVLKSEVAGLPSEIETDDIESRLFDLTALKMQLALAEGDAGTFERHRRRVVEIAMLLEDKSTIPAVAAQLAYLASVQENAFWEGITLNGLEELRLRLRGLVPFLDKKTRKVVYSDFQDEIMAVREDAAVYLPKMTGVQYEKKVQEYLKNHLDHIVIRRLRTNQPLTATRSRPPTCGGSSRRWSRSARTTAGRC